MAIHAFNSRVPDVSSLIVLASSATIRSALVAEYVVVRHDCDQLPRIRAGPLPQPTLMITNEETANFEALRDCLSNVLIQKFAVGSSKPKRRIKGRKNEIKPVEKGTDTNVELASDAEELGEFIDVGSMLAPIEGRLDSMLNKSSILLKRSIPLYLPISAHSAMLCYKTTPT